ncbi:MAG TPA: OmpH family outer membrane protein [Parafilimonas sp.]|nr:OmpH family outer membrane protein [Parafilimonas sp.]
MNKVLLTLNIVLILGLGYLYYAFFTGKKTDVVVKNQGQIHLDTAFKIAYFDLDTLEKYYVFAKETQDYLKSKSALMDGKLNKIKQDFTTKLNDYQKRGATLSQTEQSQMQEDLSRMDNYYTQQQQSLGQDLQNEIMQKMLALRNKIEAFLKDYCEQRGYVYVFATSSEDNVIYYKDSVRNITADIVAKLNEEYNSSKKK